MGRVISCVCDFVCLSVCPRSERKTTRAINTKLGRHTVHVSRLACIDHGVKRSSAKVTRLLNFMRRRRGHAARHDCLGFQFRKCSSPKPISWLVLAKGLLSVRGRSGGRRFCESIRLRRQTKPQITAHGAAASRRVTPAGDLVVSGGIRHAVSRCPALG